MTLWTSAEAAAATGGTTTPEWQATGVSIDTRTLQAGDIFVALSDVRALAIAAISTPRSTSMLMTALASSGSTRANSPALAAK